MKEIYSQTVEPFTTDLFRRDVVRTALALDSLLSEALVDKAIDTFADDFSAGVTLWKATSRALDPLSFRFFARSNEDRLSRALAADLVPGGGQMVDLVRQLASAQRPVIESCDFDTANGLAKTWLYLGGMRPVEEVLGHEFVPNALRNRIGEFSAAGLRFIRFVAVDHCHCTANLYFRAPGPIQMQQCRKIMETMGMGPLEPAVVGEMRRWLPEDFCVAVTTSVVSGQVERCCFYALNLPPTCTFDVPARIARFFDCAPCLEPSPVRVAAWSFGPRGGTYMKAEKSYHGGMADLLTDWECYFSGSTQKDPVLAARDLQQ